MKSQILCAVALWSGGVLSKNCNLVNLRKGLFLARVEELKGHMVIRNINLKS